tara:strand:- start:646 stop:1389 length:744 start_codon:yes stop_codon:yes gene_type:complete
MKKELVIGIFVLGIFLFSGFVSAQEIQIKGKVLDQITGEPLNNVKLDYFNSEIITNDKGEFMFDTNTNFDISKRWVFLEECYEYGYFSLFKDYKIYAKDESGLIAQYELASIKNVFGKEDVVKEVEGNPIIDIGDMLLPPSASVEIKSDIPFYSTEVDLTNIDGGAHGQRGYNKEHFIPIVPIGHPLRIGFYDESQNVEYSSEYTIPENAKCKTITLNYDSKENESTWRVKRSGFWQKIKCFFSKSC